MLSSVPLIYSSGDIRINPLKHKNAKQPKDAKALTYKQKSGENPQQTPNHGRPWLLHQ
jgi:hypothetical protein